MLANLEEKYNNGDIDEERYTARKEKNGRYACKD